MTDDLVKRLRGLAGRTVDLPTHYAITEAADRIEELQARVEWAEGYLRGALDVVETFSHADTSKARAADRIGQLEAALREKDNIAYIIDGHGITHITFTIVYKDKSDD